MKTHLYLKSRPPFLSSGPSRSDVQRARIRAAEADNTWQDAARRRKRDKSSGPSRWEVERLAMRAADLAIRAEDAARRRKRDKMLDARAAAMAQGRTDQGRFARFKSKVKGLLGPTAKEWARMEKEREGEEKERARNSPAAKKKEKAARIKRLRRYDMEQEAWDAYGSRALAEEKEMERLRSQLGYSTTTMPEMVEWRKARLKRYRQIWAEASGRHEDSKNAKSNARSKNEENKVTRKSGRITAAIGRRGGGAGKP